MTKLKKTLSLTLLALSLTGAAAMAAPGNVQQGLSYPALQGPSRITPTNVPVLQGATMGTIGPQGTDATVVQGLMTAGTVRVNNLANLEALLNIMANSAFLGGHVFGIWYLIRTMRLTIKTPGNVLGGLAKGLSFISIGLLTPNFVNWAVGMARDAALF